VHFEVGLDDRLRPQAARLYEEAFRQKLTPAVADEADRVALLETAIDPELAIVAVEGDELVGIAGFHEGRRSFTGGGTFRDVTARLGWLRAIWAVVVLVLFERHPADGELLLDGLVVARDARGRGIGRQLLTLAESKARSLGHSQVRLDVVDTNPRARKLYEDVGFEADRTELLPFLRRWFGFSASTTMVKAVA
jgi:ribosomal protein S18 acetylase RimI-like enzyme